jgi:MFS family permease
MGLGALAIGFALSRVVWLSYPLLFACGAAQMMVFSLMTSLVQLIAPNEMRGRVMSIYMVAFRGGMPLGSLVAGYLAAHLPAVMVVALNGLLLATVAGALLAAKDGVRRL